MKKVGKRIKDSNPKVSHRELSLKVELSRKELKVRAGGSWWKGAFIPGRS